MDDPRTKHFREIGRRGQRALVAQIRTLRAEWKTDDLLAVLNWDLPDDMTDHASVESWVELAPYPHFGTTEAVEALSRFGGVPAPPDRVYRVPGAKLVLGFLVLTHYLAINAAQALIVEQRRPERRRWRRGHH